MRALNAAIDGSPSDPAKPLRVVLAGGGHSHLAVLEDWRRNPLLTSIRTLIAPVSLMTYSGMIPGWIEGFYKRSEFEIDLGPLADASGTRFMLDEVVALDADARQLMLASGTTLEYDLLSLAVGGSLDLTPFAGAHGLLPVRPMHRFLADWEEAQAAIERRAVPKIAIVGGGAAGAELALAIAAQFHERAQETRVLLITGKDGLLSNHALAVRDRMREALSARAIEVFAEDSHTTPNGLMLSDGQVLAIDNLVVATGSHPPEWIAQSGLALGSGGGVAVGPNMQSVSHPEVFAAGDVSDRLDRHLARSGVHAVKAGPVIASNLRASVSGGKLRHYCPTSRKLALLSTGEKRAILSWGNWSAKGAWVWRLKDWIDRRFVTRFQHPPTNTSLRQRQEKTGGIT